MKKILTACVMLPAFVALALPNAAYACEKCFGAVTDDPTVQAIAMSMMSLLVMVGVVGGGISMFFVNTSRRAKLLEPSSLVVNQDGDLHPSPGQDEPGR